MSNSTSVSKNQFKISQKMIDIISWCNVTIFPHKLFERYFMIHALCYVSRTLQIDTCTLLKMISKTKYLPSSENLFYLGGMP